MKKQKHINKGQPNAIFFKLFANSNTDSEECALKQSR